MQLGGVANSILQLVEDGYAVVPWGQPSLVKLPSFPPSQTLTAVLLAKPTALFYPQMHAAFRSPSQSGWTLAPFSKGFSALSSSWETQRLENPQCTITTTKHVFPSPNWTANFSCPFARLWHKVPRAWTSTGTSFPATGRNHWNFLTGSGHSLPPLKRHPLQKTILITRWQET